MLAASVPSRVVCIASANHGDAALWTSFTTTVFSNFSFQISHQFDERAEESYRLIPKLVDLNQELFGFLEPGEDPYRRPFLYLYFVDVRFGQQLSPAQIEEFSAWLAKITITQVTFLVVVSQEVRKFGGKALDVSRLSSDPAVTQNIMVVPCRGREIGEGYVERVRQWTRDRIASDFWHCHEDVQLKIGRPAVASKKWFCARLKIWQSLLLFSFGFIDSAEVGLTESYQQLIIEDEATLDTCLSCYLDRDQIEVYPMCAENAPGPVLMFALQCLMAVKYRKTQRNVIVLLFFNYFAHLRGKCTSPEDQRRVSRWGEIAIGSLLALTLLRQNRKLAPALVSRLFYLILERDGDELQEQYDRLITLLPDCHQKRAMQSRFYLWQSERKRPTVALPFEKVVHWKFGADAALLAFNAASDNANKQQMIFHAQWLLAHRTPVADKRSVLERIADVDRVSMQNPFMISVRRIVCDRATETVPVYSPFTISLSVQGPDWMPTEYIKSSLVASLVPPGDDTRPYWGSRDNVKITDRLVFSCALPKPGTWVFGHFYLKYRKMLLIWDLLEPVFVTVIESAPPPISVRFPGLMTSQMNAKIAIDLRQVLAPKMIFRFTFAEKVAVMPPQAGRAKLVRDGVEKIVKFQLGRTGDLHLPEIPSLCQVEFEPAFKLVDTGAERETLEIATTFDRVKFSSEFHLNTRFPIKVEGRLLSDDVIHLSVMNLSDVEVFISNEETKQQRHSPPTHPHIQISRILNKIHKFVVGPEIGTSSIDWGQLSRFY
jgi:hypothetical protein